ncbi:ribosome small subunit-dependent GTPase A [Subsaximicrobium wynnwilliamsii]|uniref:Small ribosomal subunit biogenesis GTPase RsgA n=1 Tax=Subsaximicrobium wynnwilliamsii TaxID=291179 RepID=A0A5C6ZKK9_9FLAO|nr:ribosome small subunit-dependent GTPase A [Subsaximicrobium wynnwilliamsii]TXD85424.1 ribosome small subunit-dependent GTPase A [Subsaximicrobium wynnwilliamsii]TXD90777.1 ribosome small subunit-dependent GTPase A [Subsaximicrobium wynnwilliamsii]TXE05284.1 ribosome small subunit-dependent GTPase A [Subsaximicrobium wynnwilliamsii]
MTGTVYKSTGSWYTVNTDLGASYQCRIKGKFRLKGIKSTNPIAVGDHVDFELETNNDVVTGVIHRIHDRTNYIIRKSVNLSKQTHIIASNIDQVFLLVTIDNPPTFTSFIDRFLVTAEAYSIKTVILFNKVDTYSNDTLDEVRFLAHVYRKIGYECIGISAETGKNVDQVKALMADKVSMFAGHSGVGKSTLINAIETNLDLKTKAISAQHQQGQHTTTFAEMFDLSFGAQIIDTPGIKGFGIVDMDKEEVGDYFPEFFKLKQDCKFNNCLHIEEPNCAVKNALDKDEVAYSRYKSYVQIIENDDENYRTDIWETQ